MLEIGMNNGRVGVVGTGLIGASWAAAFLAAGLEVSATDPSPGAEDGLRRLVAGVWPDLARLGLAPGASPDKLSFAPTAAAALDGVGFVQENGPEVPDLKARLFAELDALLPPEVVIASSASGFPISLMQAACTRHPERCVIGHPFNPPHLMPLVEVVGGPKTSEAAIAKAMAFYAAIGKKPVRLRKEMPGHLANRLQAALFREILHILQEGAAGIGEIDAVVRWGPGLRWGLMGPGAIAHLSGGTEGIRGFVERYAGAMTKWWAPKDPILTPELKDALIAGVEKEAAATKDLAGKRDEGLLGLLELRKRL